MSERLVAPIFLKTNGTAWQAKALTSGSAYYCDAIPVSKSTGYAALKTGMYREIQRVTRWVL